MSENTVDLLKPGQLESKSWAVRQEIEIPKSDNAIEDKRRITLEGRDHNISLVTRRLTSNPILRGFGIPLGPIESRSDIYILAWQTLKDRGMPVVDTVRKIDNSQVATTDLVANGYSVYDAKLDSQFNRESIPADKSFAEIPLEEIEKRANHVLEEANRQGIYLPKDGLLHIAVKNSEDWKLVLLDINDVLICKDQNKIPESWKEENADHTRMWLRQIRRIQDRLR